MSFEYLITSCLPQVSPNFQERVISQLLIIC